MPSPARSTTTYYVKCAAEHRDVALDVLVDMLRNSRFEEEEIEREKGVIIEEMNMYYDTPRDFVGGVYEQLLWGDQPLGRDIIGRKETIRDATRDTFMGYLDRWYKPSRMVLGVAGAIGDGLLERAQELLGDLADGETGEPEPTAPYANGRVVVHTKQSEQAHVILGVSSLPIDHPDRYAISAAGDRARRRHVVAAVQRGARAARARVLRLRAQPQLHRRRDAVFAGGRGHQPHRRRRGDDRRRAPQGRRRAAASGRAREGAQLLEGPLRPLAREPAGARDCSGCGERCWSGRSPTPTTCWRESTQSRATTWRGSRQS